MTLADGKRKVLMLLDEYSSGGEITQDIDLNNKMADFFDMAQKDMAQYQPIVATANITLSDTGYTDLPAGFKSYFRVWRDGKQKKRYPIVGGKMYNGTDTGDIMLEYIKTPDTITTSTPDSTAFEVNESAANCLPFYVAAQQLIVDLVVDYSALWQMYLTMRAGLPNCMPSSGGGFIRQTMYRGE